MTDSSEVIKKFKTRKYNFSILLHSSNKTLNTSQEHKEEGKHL